MAFGWRQRMDNAANCLTTHDGEGSGQIAVPGWRLGWRERRDLDSLHKHSKYNKHDSKSRFPPPSAPSAPSLNLTQEQLAERLGVSFATVNRWEGGTNAAEGGARRDCRARRGSRHWLRMTRPLNRPRPQPRSRAAGAAPTGQPCRRPSRWSRCCGMRPARSGARRTRRSSRTTCCRCCS